MNDLRKDSSPRNYLARREQWRLLMLIVGLGAIIVVGLQLRQEGAATRVLETLFGAGGPREGPIDTRLQTTNEPDAPPDAIRIPREVAPPEDQTGDYLPGVRPGYLEGVRDDTFFRNDESDAWFHLFKLLDNADPEQLREASEGKISFAQLFQQSDFYRGKVVSLEGIARRAMPLDAPANEYGIERYWRVWLSPDDNPSDPIIIYTLNLPEGFPEGMHIEQPIGVDGFYYKRLAYEAADTLRTAPTVLAKTLQWTPPPPRESGRVLPFWAIALIAAIGSSLVVGYIYWKTRPTRHGEEASPPDFSGLVEQTPFAGPPASESESERRRTEHHSPGDQTP